MSFGRWLLIHSFSIFLVTVLIFGYIYRVELKLDQVYSQLFNIEPRSTTNTSRSTSPPVVKELQPGPSVNPIGPVTGTGTVEAISPQPKETDKPVISPVLPTVTESSPPLQPAADDAFNFQDELFFARQAYWDKNYKVAIDQYQNLIQSDKNNPDYRGELGNIYYALNDYSNASKLYYQSALILIQQNRPEQARLLVSPITAMNRELGEELKSKLR